MVCEIDQLSWDRSLAFGEAKLAEPSTNTANLANDLWRLGVLNAKAVGKSKMRRILAFQIHGK